MDKLVNKPRVGAGNVVITLGIEEYEKEYELVPTLAAAQGVSRIGGGIRGAMDAIVKLDLDIITRVVQLGLGPTVTKTVGPRLPDLIWQAGLTDSGGELAAKCIEYLTMLSNGGRPITTTEEVGDGADGPPT
jgi:hypothetical protein